MVWQASGPSVIERMEGDARKSELKRKLAAGDLFSFASDHPAESGRRFGYLRGLVRWNF